MPFKNGSPIAPEDWEKEKMIDTGNKSANLIYVGNIVGGMK